MPRIQKAVGCPTLSGTMFLECHLFFNRNQILTVSIAAVIECYPVSQEPRKNQKVTVSMAVHSSAPGKYFHNASVTICSFREGFPQRNCCSTVVLQRSVTALDYEGKFSPTKVLLLCLTLARSYSHT